MNYFDIQIAGKIIPHENDYEPEDVGKVVTESGGEYSLTAQTSRSITENGTYDTTLNNEVTVNVSGGGGNDIADFANRVDKEYDLTGVTTIPTYFAYRFPNVKIKALDATAIEEYAFGGGTAGNDASQFSFDWSKITNIGQYAFEKRNLPETIYAPDAFAGTSAFYEARGLKNITLHHFGGQYVFWKCKELETVRATNFASYMITNYDFQYCTSLKDIYLEGLTNSFGPATSAWTGSNAAADGTGVTIHVPANMVDSCKANSNWQAFLALNANNAIIAI